MDNKFIKKLEKEIEKSNAIISKLTAQRDKLNNEIKAETENKKSLETTKSNMEKLVLQAKQIEDKFNSRNEKPQQKKESESEFINDMEESETEEIISDSKETDNNDVSYTDMETSQEDNEEFHVDDRSDNERRDVYNRFFNR